jgi:hypothetical protein
MAESTRVLSPSGVLVELGIDLSECDQSPPLERPSCQAIEKGGRRAAANKLVDTWIIPGV